MATDWASNPYNTGFSGLTQFEDEYGNVVASFDWGTGAGTGFLSDFSPGNLGPISSEFMNPSVTTTSSGLGSLAGTTTPFTTTISSPTIGNFTATTTSPLLGNLATLKIPTAQEMEDILSTKSLGGKWNWLNEYLGKIGGNPLIQQQIYPVLQGALRGLYNRGMGSSSFADRAVRELAQKYDPSQYITGSNNILDLILNTAKSASAT